MPDLASPLPEAAIDVSGVRITDESSRPTWRTWADQGVPLGHSGRAAGTVVLAVAPGEWLVLGDRPDEGAVDLTHVRAAIRVTGAGARRLLEHVCALDLDDDFTPDGAAARTLVAGVATELLRDDAGDEPSYLLLMSRSFARSTWDRLAAVAAYLVTAGLAQPARRRAVDLPPPVKRKRGERPLPDVVQEMRDEDRF